MWLPVHSIPKPMLTALRFKCFMIKYIRFLRGQQSSSNFMLQSEKWPLKFGQQQKTSWFLCACSGSLQGEYQRKLYKDLLANYNRLERPVVNDSASILVELGLTLLQIIDVVRMSTFLYRLIQIYQLQSVLSWLLPSDAYRRVDFSTR